MMPSPPAPQAQAPNPRPAAGKAGPRARNPRGEQPLFDRVILDLSAGNGGRGSVSFRREKYVPMGGPDGGNGGRGGNIILEAVSSRSTLDAYRDRRRHRAANGGGGSGALRSGKDGRDLVLPVPAGTVVRDADSGEVLADLDVSGARLVVAQGGRGGRGNTRFRSAVRRAPRVAELGEKGSSRRIDLELKLIADIGLVGLPNAGKSTLLGAITGAQPRVADYPFTTLRPNLGVAELEGGHTVVLADVPGLIEGAHLGVGLGIEFLRHLERTRVLIHVIDASVGAEAAMHARAAVTAELQAASPTLAAKPAIVALNKMDLPAARKTVAELAAGMGDAFAIAGVTGEGCAALLRGAVALLQTQRVVRAPVVAEAPTGPTHRIYRHGDARSERHGVLREEDAFRVVGRDVERLVEMTDLQSEEGVARMQRRLRMMGVEAALIAQGCGEGDSVRIGDDEFTFAPG